MNCYRCGPLPGLPRNWLRIIGDGDEHLTSARQVRSTVETGASPHNIPLTPSVFLTTQLASSHHPLAWLVRDLKPGREKKKKKRNSVTYSAAPFLTARANSPALDLLPQLGQLEKGLAREKSRYYYSLSYSFGLCATEIDQVKKGATRSWLPPCSCIRFLRALSLPPRRGPPALWSTVAQRPITRPICWEFLSGRVFLPG